MNSQERAEKIVRRIDPLGKWGITSDWIAAQIEAAEREAWSKAQKEHGDKWTEISLRAYAEGFAAARDMAKGIACNFTRKKVWMDVKDEIATRIGAMKPWEGK